MTNDESILEKPSRPAHGTDAGAVRAGTGAGGVRLENDRTAGRAWHHAGGRSAAAGCAGAV